ncbi:hypothetical protein TB2_034764 [Malus domestica]
MDEDGSPTIQQIRVENPSSGEGSIHRAIGRNNAQRLNEKGKNFPGTGDIRDITHYVPLDDGIDDESYHYLFKPIIGKVMENFKPGDVVRQCGADSLSGDGLGCFNLSIKVHAECARYIRSFNVPLLLLGGGGYTIHNVARCTCCGVALGAEVEDKMPQHEYYEYFGPDYTLHVCSEKDPPDTELPEENEEQVDLEERWDPDSDMEVDDERYFNIFS